MDLSSSLALIKLHSILNFSCVRPSFLSMTRVSNQLSPKTKVVGCRSSLPLQLLFWPNFMFPYENLSFGWSNSSQFQSNELTVPPCASTVLAHTATGAASVTPRVATAGDPCPPCASPYPFACLDASRPVLIFFIELRGALELALAELCRHSPRRP